MAFPDYFTEPQQPLGTVYVVDDDEAVCDSVRWLLEAGNYKVEIFDSGESFIAKYDPQAIAVLLLYDKLGTRRVLQLGMCVVFCAFAVFNLVKCYLPATQRSLNDTDDIAEHQLADFVAEEGYDYIYAQWYYGSRVAVRADGAAIAGTWHDAPLEILGYINPQNIYSEEDNSRAVYIVADDELDAFLERADELGATVTKVFDAGHLDAYESTKQLMYFPENS